ncbi:MAG: nickel pincer cofactor biosynthesis protein LarB [Oscillospiraceae bacterium]|nr:nickel pincer cofactor biosynthesis protein LarB [Oscillospiraceae bacterium]
MNLEALLNGVADGSISTESAIEKLKTLPYEEVGDYARLDNHRKIRTGFPEVVFCQGKRVDQCAEIFKRLYDANGLVLGTRASIEQYDAVRELLPNAVFHEIAKCITVGEPEETVGCVAVCTAGTTDIPVAEEAAITAYMCGSTVEKYYDVGVAGIHRLLSKVNDIRRANAVVAVAGMEGALATVVGGLVDVPVLAVPTSIGYGANFGGLSALLAMLNSCAAGTSVVNIDNGFSAGYSAAQINQIAVKGGKQ